MNFKESIQFDSKFNNAMFSCKRMLEDTEKRKEKNETKLFPEIESSFKTIIEDIERGNPFIKNGFKEICLKKKEDEKLKRIDLRFVYSYLVDEELFKSKDEIVEGCILSFTELVNGKICVEFEFSSRILENGFTQTTEKVQIFDPIETDYSTFNSTIILNFVSTMLEKYTTWFEDLDKMEEE